MSDDGQMELPLDFGGPVIEEWVQALWSEGGIVDQLSEERMRQVEKWGRQDHPYFSGRDIEDDARANYGYSAQNMKHWNGVYVQNKQLGWDTILLEEVWEALEKAGLDDIEYEEELIQVMAVAAAMIEANRRKRGAPYGRHTARSD